MVDGFENCRETLLLQTVQQRVGFRAIGELDVDAQSPMPLRHTLEPRPASCAVRAERHVRHQGHEVVRLRLARSAPQ